MPAHIAEKITDTRNVISSVTSTSLEALAIELHRANALRARSCHLGGRRWMIKSTP
jgi:hypothetical protein